MVRIISQYDALVQTVRASDSYQKATEKRKQEINEWLGREDIIKYFSSRFVPQLTLHESLVLGFANSDALRQRTSEEQSIVLGYLNSKRFGSFVDNLERRVNEVLRV